MRHTAPCLLLALSVLAPTAATAPGPVAQQLGSDGDLHGAIVEARHAVRTLEDGSRVARSLAHSYATHFDGRSAHVVGEDWCFELALERFGRANAWQVLDRPERVDHEGRRVAYTWADGVTEWFVNRDGGLEHGFDLTERPAGEGELVMQLTLETDLDVALADDARTLRFTHADDRHACDYAGLVAFDAKGTDLAARFELAGDHLRIVVDDAPARYPITIDPLVQTDYLKSPDPDASDRFGHAVAIDGNTAVVGVPFEDGVGGLDSNPTSNGLSDAGAAFVFVRTSSGWAEQAYLKPSSRSIDDSFGDAVAIDGDRVVVGCPGDDSGATGVGGNSSDNGTLDAGAAWVFVRSGSTWSQEAYLKASNTGASDRFGEQVAIHGDLIVVGAENESGSGTGVDPVSNDGAATAGAAYVFRRSGGTWTHDAYLKASNTDSGDAFGSSVAVHGETIAIGARLEDSAAIGVGGDQSNNGAPGSGAVYVFVQGVSGWTQQAYVKATNTGTSDGFGWSVDLEGDTLVVGAPFEDGGDGGVGGDQSDNSRSGAGATYTFERVGTSWFASGYLKADAPDAQDQFGYDVALDRGTIAVGAPLEDGSDPGIGGNPFDDGASDAGAVYLFQRAGLTWQSRAYVKASLVDAGDRFGLSVDVDADTLIVGAPFEDGSGLSPAENFAGSAGASYLFEIGYWDLVPGCFANPAQILAPATSAHLGETFRFTVQAASITTGVSACFWGASGVDASGCGTLIAFGEEVLLGAAPVPKLVGVEALTAFKADHTFPIPDAPSLAGIRVTLQAVVVDTSTFASEFSRGLEIEVRP